MTELVISQEANTVIATNQVIADLAAMAKNPEKLVPPDLINEMRADRIGYRMRLLREAQGLLPSEMADRLEIERTYWSRFENGKRRINDNLAALLVSRFGVTLDFLLLGKWDKLPMDLADAMREADLKNK